MTCLSPGVGIGPEPPAPGYPPYDPHFEMSSLVDPLTGTAAHVPISPCPSVKHRHDFDGQKNKHLASWNVSASGVVGPSFAASSNLPLVFAHPSRICRSCFGWVSQVPDFMQNKRLDAWDEYREDIGWQNRSAACVDLDDLIDAVFDGFESMGVLNNTYVIFSSDNG